MLDFLIAGCPRSGTTLLAKILTRHSSITVPDETGLLYHGIGHRKHPLRFNLLKRSIPRVFLSNTSLEIKEKASYAHFIKIFRDHHSKNKPVFGEKTPRNWYYLDIIDKLSSQTSVIFIQRDCESVINSFKKYRQKWFPFYHAPNLMKLDIGLPFLVWKNSEKMYEKCKARKIKVHYIDLVSDPLDTILSITNFLGVKFEGHVTETPLKTEPLSQFVVTHKRDFDAHQNLHKPITTDRNMISDALTTDDKEYIRYLEGNNDIKLYKNKLRYPFYFLTAIFFYHLSLFFDRLYDNLKRMKG